MAKEKEPRAEGEVTRVTIRMPAELHAALLKRREGTGHSLNDLLVEAAARLLGVPVPEMPKGIPGRRPGKRPKGKRSSTG